MRFIIAEQPYPDKFICFFPDSCQAIDGAFIRDYAWQAGLHCQSVLTDRLAKRTTLHVVGVSCACLSRTPLRWNGRGTRSRVLILSYQSVNPLSFCHPSFDSDLAGLLYLAKESIMTISIAPAFLVPAQANAFSNKFMLSNFLSNGSPFTRS